MPFAVLSRVDPKNHVLDVVQITRQEGAHLEEFLAHCKA